MNAAETLKQASAAAEQRAYEPSMEEILASIRRIIADDQSLPNRAFVRDGEAVLRAALDAPETLATDTAFATVDEPVEHVSAAPLPDADVAAMPDSVADEPAMPEGVQSAPIVATGGVNYIAAPQHGTPDSLATTPVTRHPQDEAEGVSMPDVRGNLARHEPLAFEGGPASSNAAAERSPARGHGLEATNKDGEAEAMSSLFSSATDQTVTAAFNTLAASRLLENDDALKDMVRDMLLPLLKSWLDDNLPNMVERLVRAEIERVGRGGR